MHISISTSTSLIIGVNYFLDLFVKWAIQIFMVVSSAHLTTQNIKQKLQNIVIFIFQFWRLNSGIVKHVNGTIWNFVNYLFILIRCRSANAMENIKCQNYFELAQKLQFKIETVATGVRGVADEGFDGNCK